MSFLVHHLAIISSYLCLCSCEIVLIFTSSSCLMNGNIQFGVLHYHAMKLPAEKLQAVFQATDKFAFFFLILS